MSHQADPPPAREPAPRPEPTPAAPVRPLHVFESWRPVVSGYTSRSWELIGAQARAGGFEPRVLVSSRQAVYGAASGLDAPPGLDGRIRLVEPSPPERQARRLRAFHVDGPHLERAILAAATAWGADLIHVHWSSVIGRAAATAARRLGVPLVAEVRFDLAGAMMSETLRLPWSLPPLERALRARFEAHLAGAAAVVAAGASLGRQLRAWRPDLADRIWAVPNGVDTERFRPGPPDPALRRALGLEGKRVVGTTSNMLHYEGLDRLIDALAALRVEVPDVHGLFVGGGPQAGALARRAARRGVPVTFTGLVPADRVADHLRQLDLFVIPRRDVTITRHAGPIKLVEAMACGLAVVGAPVGDIPDLLAEGRGTVVEDATIPALTRALADLARRPDDRRAQGERARRHAEIALPWSAAAGVHRDVYRHALATTAATPGGRPGR